MSNKPLRRLSRGVLRRLKTSTQPTRGADQYRELVLTERARVRELRQRVLELRDERNELRRALAESGAEVAYWAPLGIVQTAGAPLELAVVEFVRSGQKKDVPRAKIRAFCHALMERPSTSSLGHLGYGVYLALEELYVASDSCFTVAGPELARQFAPVEYFMAKLDADTDAGVQQLGEYLARHRDELPHQEHLDLLKVLARHLRLDALAAELPYLQEREAATAQLDEEGAKLLRWFADRLEHYGEPARPLDPGTISLAVMDYHLLDRSRTSSNRGDYVQTLAALANICRFSDVEFVGGSDLAELMTELQGEIKPERRLPGVTAKVSPVPLDRDFSHGRQYPDDTWLLCNGWFMHRNYRGEIDFPFPETVHPIFLSFHLNDPDLLDQEVADSLKPYEPIGCRDWTSVYRLADFGVQAFFSGCLTSTVGQVMPPITHTEPGRIAVVEAAVSPEELAGKKVDRVIQIGEFVRDFTLVEGVRDAREMLTGYLPVETVYTHRLHCYLPATSMGLKVEFRPKNRADIRFEGLLDLDEAAFLTMRTGIEDRLEKVFGAIFSGQSPDEVMQLWRELAAPDVEFANKYRATFPDPEPTSIDVAGTLAQIRATALTRLSDSGDTGEIPLAFGIDQNLKDQLAVVLQSIADHTTRRMDVHLMGRGLDEAYLDRLHALLPEFSFTLYDFGSVDYGEAVRTLTHITVSTMDRLFLPELLAEVDKVLYLDADILVQADVAELFDMDLDGAVIAGKQSNHRLWKNAVRMSTRASLHLPAEKAWELRRRLHYTHKLSARTFNAGVLVMDLATMRAEKFTESYLYLGEHCHFNDQDILNVYANGRVRYLDPSWNHVPNQDQIETARIIHWAGPVKPWKPLYIWGNRLYDATLARVTSEPPAS